MAASGVRVIDAKKHSGTVRIERGGLLGRGEPRLMVDGRDHSSMADGLVRQVAAVAAALGGDASVIPLYGILCFLSSEWPLLDRPRQFRCFQLESPRSLTRLLRGAGPLTPMQVGGVAETLAKRLPPR